MFWKSEYLQLSVSTWISRRELRRFAQSSSSYAFNVNKRVSIFKQRLRLLYMFSLVVTDHCHSQPCLNNGSCVNSVFQYHCNCLKGFQGLHCQGRYIHLYWVPNKLIKVQSLPLREKEGEVSSVNPSLEEIFFSLLRRRANAPNVIFVI